MSIVTKIGLRAWLAGGVAAAAVVMAAPSAGQALGLVDSPAPSLVPGSNFAGFTPAAVDPRVARLVNERLQGKTRSLRFTPAGVAARENRSVTVAVRVDQDAADALTSRSGVDAAPTQASANPGLNIVSTRYNLGLARGYRSFVRAPEISSSLSNADIPDLADFAPSPAAAAKESRFAARIELDEPEKEDREQLGIDPIGDQSLDVAGSYRLTRNLDVTAGVRYSQERDRYSALPDIEEQDSQAVYIGTQFRF